MLNLTEHEIFHFFMLINVKMQTAIGILTFISMIDTNLKVTKQEILKVYLSAF